MRLGLALLAVLSLLTAGASFGGAPRATGLSITVYPQGFAEHAHHVYTLRCRPARGTVPNPARACRTLARLADPFAPVPPGTICTDLALGPQEAFVRGRLRGRVVKAHLTVRGGCEIERWRRLADVVPGFPGRR
jgi:aminoglycoside phosphotransferase (APT) family kinase protein